MSEQPRSRLALKLAANRQRQSRQNFLQLLPTALRSYLASAEFITTPDSDEIIEIFHLSKQGVGVKSPICPSGFTYFEFGWAERAFECLRTFGDRHDLERGYFRPFGINVSSMQSWSDWIHSELPVFEVDFRWGREHLEELFDHSLHGIALTTKSFLAGIIVSVTCGILENDPNPHEQVYEVGYWG